MSGWINKDSPKSCLKILQVSDAYYPHPGGVSEHIHHLAQAMRLLGQDVRILAPSYPGGNKDPEWIDRIGKAVILPGNRSQITLTFDLMLPLKVRSYLRREDFNVVHTHGPFGFNLPYWALHYSKAVNVATFHTAFVGSNLYRYAKLFSKNSIAKLDGKIAVSQTASNAINPYFPGNYRIIANGIDTQRFNPEVNAMPEITKYRNRILFVGRLDPRKGLEYLVMSLPILAKKLTEFHLFIVGEGNINQYLRLIPKSLHARVHYLGYVSTKDIPRVYRSCDCCVFPSIGGETFGIVLLEAMASGVPVIASGINGYDEVIDDQHDGILVKAKQPRAIAQAIEAIFKNNKLKTKLVENGSAKASQFDWTNIGRQVLSYYQELGGESKIY